MDAPLWVPPAPGRTAMDRFRRVAERTAGRALPDYDALWAWSVAEPAAFWDLWRVESGLRMSAPEAVLENPVLPGARWFRGARCNFSENLLRLRDRPGVALVACDEEGGRRRWSRSELADRAGRFAAWLLGQGVEPGDRVVGFLGNGAEAVIAHLGAAWIGAVWSSCSPDFGEAGVLDRFGQIGPKVLVAADGAVYGGRRHDNRARVAALASALPGLRAVVGVSVLGLGVEGATPWDEAVADPVPQFADLPFDHPLVILYSSGTTGVPKCIVHGTGGTLLQHSKEHLLHCDLGPDDVVFWYTTTGWMMWNWLVGALFAGARVVLYDGSPVVPDAGVLWELAEREGVTFFGTSPRFVATCAKAGVVPRARANLSRVRAVGSTGSPLPPDGFRWIADNVGDVQIASICGGTDIVSCFMLGCPTEPVYAGEIQKRGLGMAVAAFGEDGRPVPHGKGELVCTAPAPSMPLGFWNDPDGAAFRRAYFSTFPGVWHHGDFIEITERGGVIVYGRSDATLNPGGVRIGTAEIQRQVETVDEVVDSLVVGQQWQDDVRVVLFVVLREGLLLDRTLEDRIRAVIRRNTTPRHVPAKILQCPAVPRTVSGKSVEIAVTRVIHGQPVQNREALANPEALDWFRERPELS
jgi:acetoacetyl-CoA synthetase